MKYPFIKTALLTFSLIMSGMSHATNPIPQPIKQAPPVYYFNQFMGCLMVLATRADGSVPDNAEMLMIRLNGVESVHSAVDKSGHLHFDITTMSGAHYGVRMPDNEQDKHVDYYDQLVLGLRNCGMQ